MSEVIEKPVTRGERVARLRFLALRLNQLTGPWHYIKDYDTGESYDDGDAIEANVIRAEDIDTRDSGPYASWSHQIAKIDYYSSLVGEFIALCQETVPDLFEMLDDADNGLFADQKVRVEAWRLERDQLRMTAARDRREMMKARDRRREYGIYLEKLVGWLNMTCKLAEGPWDSALHSDLRRGIRLAEEAEGLRTAEAEQDDLRRREREELTE